MKTHSKNIPHCYRFSSHLPLCYIHIRAMQPSFSFLYTSYILMIFFLSDATWRLSYNRNFPGVGVKWERKRFILDCHEIRCAVYFSWTTFFSWCYLKPFPLSFSTRDFCCIKNFNYFFLTSFVKKSLKSWLKFSHIRFFFISFCRILFWLACASMSYDCKSSQINVTVEIYLTSPRFKKFFENECFCIWRLNS